MISCIIPTLNERGAIEALLLELRKTFEYERGIEFVFVDDGSTDGTAEFILDKQKTTPVPLRVIRRQERGLATAVVRGFHEARGNILCVMDADLSHPPEILKKLIKAVSGDNHDIAVASRRISGGGVEEWPIHRNLFSRVSALFARFLAAGIRDPLSGFFCLKRSVIDGVKFNPLGYKILLEILVKGQYKSAVEIPYVFKNREMGKSKLNSTQAILYFKHLWRLYKYKFYEKFKNLNDMTNKPWKTLKSEVFKQTPWTTFRHNEFEMPNGKRGDYYFVDSGGSSFIIPITKEGKFVLIKQYRYLINEDSYEFPGGGVDSGDDFEKTAGKELQEETGYLAEKFAYIGEFVPWNGVTNERCKVFLATGLKKGDAAPEATEENIKILEISKDEMEDMIRKNIIKDGQTLASWALIKYKIL